MSDVQFVQYPNDRNRSIMINQYADPILDQEAIQAQSGNVDIITGATDSSYAFMQSLGRALIGPRLDRRLPRCPPMHPPRASRDAPAHGHAHHRRDRRSRRDSGRLERVFAYFTRLTSASAPIRPTARSRGSIAASGPATLQRRHARDSGARRADEARDRRLLRHRARRLSDPSGIVKGWAIRNAAQLLGSRRPRLLRRRRRRHRRSRPQARRTMARRHPQPLQPPRDRQDPGAVRAGVATSGTASAASTSTIRTGPATIRESSA